MKVIEANKLCIEYTNKKNKVIALENFSFCVNKGELVVILGPSGSGKTTLLHTIAGLNEYSSGELFINGIDANYLAIKDRNLSYVMQTVWTYPFLSVYSNIGLPLKVAKVPLEEIDRRINEVASVLQIEHLLTRKPRQLSLGQQQRVALAKALIKNPDIYLLDEPFSNLDQLLRIELRKLILDIHQKYQATMLLVSHDINDALLLADRIILIEDSKNHREISKEELKKSMVNLNDE